jgi:malonyl-CoA O-methyltransferase
MSTGRRVPDEFRLDGRQVRRSFGRAAHDYDAAAVLQTRVRNELLERLDLVRIEPGVVLDLGAGTGHASSALKRRYRSSQVVALDLAEGMLREAARRQSLLRRFRRVCADAAALPLRDGTVDIVFSNLVLQWCDDPDQVFGECRRVLKPGGLLTFATFGPDTLVELRRAWAAADGRTHVNRFVDMHDLGDALVRSGFAEPVLDVERYTLTYAEVRDLMRDLKSMGAHNVNAGRPKGLTGKGALTRMVGAYESFRRDGRLPATYEVVFGHAWAPVGGPRPPHGSTEVSVPLSRIGHRSQTKPERNY